MTLWFFSIATGISTGLVHRLTVRYTIDSWKTHHDAVAAHMQAGAGAADRYRAILHFPSQVPCKLINLAVRYEAVGREFWDNNSGHYYNISVTCV